MLKALFGAVSGILWHRPLPQPAPIFSGLGSTAGSFVQQEIVSLALECDWNAASTADCGACKGSDITN